MSFYVRSRTGGLRSSGLLRLTTTLALAAYPAGGVLMIAGPAAGLSEAASSLGGYALIALSLLCFALIAPSYFQRIAGEQTRLLDERELDLRRRAYAFAYQGFTVLALLGVIYLAIATDTHPGRRIELWTPHAYEHWNTIFWGVMLYAFVLPTAWLSWAAPAPIGEDED